MPKRNSAPSKLSIFLGEIRLYNNHYALIHFAHLQNAGVKFSAKVY
jgi:hypothetical protein